LPVSRFFVSSRRTGTTGNETGSERMAKVRTMAVQQDTVYIFPRVGSARIFDYQPFDMKRRVVILIDGLKEVGRKLSTPPGHSQGFHLRDQPSRLESSSDATSQIKMVHGNRSRHRITQESITNRTEYYKHATSPSESQAAEYLQTPKP
jgi:hypothetical protein